MCIRRLSRMLSRKRKIVSWFMTLYGFPNISTIYTLKCISILMMTCGIWTWRALKWLNTLWLVWIANTRWFGKRERRLWKKQRKGHTSPLICLTSNCYRQPQVSVCWMQGHHWKRLLTAITWLWIIFGIFWMRSLRRMMPKRESLREDSFGCSK